MVVSRRRHAHRPTITAGSEACARRGWVRIIEREAAALVIASGLWSPLPSPIAIRRAERAAEALAA
ncbi:hypothetical protein GCM10022281_03710 [Sphingomonas rosea]|uniref:Uncharacterized protein n=1 Tax=Sphingomonas rosea TaxID=335605 RepID=A0ABP7TM95_9SPHN